MSSVPAALKRCLNSPYLAEDESRRALVPDEIAGAAALLDAARTAFGEEDEATGYKHAWGAMFRAARALAYQAGYQVEQLKCLEIALRAHYESIGDEEIQALRRAQELVGPPDVALERAENFLELARSLASRGEAA